MIRKLYDNEDDMPIQTRFSLITMARKVAETMGEEWMWTLSGLCCCWWRSLLPPPPVLLLPSLSLLFPPDHLLQSSLLLFLSLNLSPSAFILLSEPPGFLGKVDHFLSFSAECCSMLQRYLWMAPIMFWLTYYLTIYVSTYFSTNERRPLVQDQRSGLLPGDLQPASESRYREDQVGGGGNNKL